MDAVVSLEVGVVVLAEEVPHRGSGVVWQHFDEELICPPGEPRRLVLEVMSGLLVDGWDSHDVMGLLGLAILIDLRAPDSKDVRRHHVSVDRGGSAGLRDGEDLVVPRVVVR